MPHALWLFQICCLSICLLLGVSATTLAQNIARAKLGIQIHSHGGVRWAKATDRVNAGDTFRIFVVPQESSYVYVVHFNDRTVTQLIPERIVDSKTALVFPPDDTYHPFHKTRKKDAITIIASPRRLVNIWSLLRSSNNMPHAEWYQKWKDTEKQLIEKSAFDLSESTAEGIAYKQIHIGGTVRALPNTYNTEGDAVQYTLHPDRVTSCDEAVTFRASNLPLGLSIDSSTGTITGTLSSDAAAQSPYRVAVTLLNQQNKPCWEGRFVWEIKDKPFAKALQELRIFSGKLLVIKHYEFTVKR